MIQLFQPINSEGDQPWGFFGRNDAKAETPVLWLPHAKSWLIGKDCDAGRDWGQEEKGMTGWDGWKASLSLWTWVWVNSGSWWWTGRAAMLWYMGLQRVGHDWVAELNWTVKGFGKVNKAEIDVFLELSCFVNDPVDAGNWIYGSSAFLKTNLNIWKFTVHVLLKLG